ncbi:protein bicaudal C homolog 1-A-like [Acipenser ruthenus]|uniref:protein bicaudal C homolog 1-A-like n=1 Tax=Acipenser ruthenus TaxID=7906 RepID=UPI002740754E|nr:protein bicaudal C homolog 1-A-like [Acipenser ruthenus]
MATVKDSLELQTASAQTPPPGDPNSCSSKEDWGESCPEPSEETLVNAGETAPTDPEWVEERFRIDRKKLETMLHTPGDENRLTGEEFFQKVMSETNTQIKWPSKLKIGAKSKKDPHVKVEGKKAGVLEAKKKILDVLETKVNKVTLKMDVAHTEHSHVIGKGGSNIKKVMEETGCHIHFPDSNRNNVHLEKSNQVSIAGSLSGVESARRRIRDLQPLVLSFDLPMSMVSHTVPDVNSPVIHHISQAFNISVSFRQQPKLYSTTCLVRGLQGNCVSIQKATAVLMELLLGADPSVSVSTQLELTSQQHVFLMGQNGANFINIMHMTQTQIVFPDLNCPQNRATLLIQGTADTVCLAKQQLQDCLPLCLMFDLKEDAEVEPHKLSQMMQNLGVFISVKPKVKQAAKSVVVKSLERNTVNLYEARRLLLGLETSEVAMAIKPACDIPLTNGLTNYWLNLISQQLSLTDSGPVPSFGAVVNAVLQAKDKPTPPPGLTLQHQADREAQRSDGKKPTEMNKNMLSEAEDLQSTPSIVRPSADTVPECEEPQGMRADTRRSSSQSEGSKEPWQEGSTAASRQNTALQNLKELLLKCDLGSDYSEKPSSLRKDITELQETGPDAIKNEDYDYEKKKLLATRAMLKKPVETEVRTPTDTWSGLGFSKSMPAEAVKEMRCVNRRSYKSYLGNNLQEWSLQESLSKESLASGSDSENWRERRDSASSSSPLSSSSASSFPVFASSSSRSRADKSSESFLSSSNYFDSISSLTCSSNCCSSPTHKQTADLPELFSQLGLGKYIDIFQQQEIDFQTFLTLTDEDLKEVGISTFGARRKMLLAISDFSKSKKKLLDPPTVRPGYLEGGASGRLPRIVDVDIAAQSNRW